MTEKEICVRMTRAAAKRKAMATEEERVTKKRVVLGDLPNVTNLNQKRVIPKPTKSLGAPAKQRKTAPVVSGSDIYARSDDPKMCGPYVSDIYEYLREMEVPHLQLEPLSCYLSELSLLDYKAVKFVPSMLAASAVFLARLIIRPKQHPWNKMLEEYTKYKAADLQVCVGIIHDLYLSRRGGALQAVRDKYKHHKCVATMPVSPDLPVTYLKDVTI
ncbi:hypothetical protein Bca4012_037736 [Brassica carinata]